MSTLSFLPFEIARFFPESEELHKRLKIKMGGSEKALNNVRASSQDASTANIAEMIFANNDEAELAALGKIQQLRVYQETYMTDLFQRWDRETLASSGFLASPVCWW